MRSDTALREFAALRGLSVTRGGDEFVLEGPGVRMTQGTIIHPRSGGRLVHFRLTFEPYEREPSYMLTPQGATRWSGSEPGPCAPEEVPGHDRFAAPLKAFADEVKTHWQLKLGEQGKLYLEALERVSPRAWELAWQVLTAIR
jgi:hypothetical protein